ncbi:hypothetical protein QBC40DRAFT_11591 [Triangularia verruculosa]|uniref:Uncharacterized protein n=1 Tax=Triangularia verruculosa TaxID=2587418 RepID=A0AAN6XB32_9PEZI|nr:hypothetical protein QBC40DRAFT_11591 [Triangularia verruculosa]
MHIHASRILKALGKQTSDVFISCFFSGFDIFVFGSWHDCNCLGFLFWVLAGVKCLLVPVIRRWDNKRKGNGGRWGARTGSLSPLSLSCLLVAWGNGNGKQVSTMFYFFSSLLLLFPGSVIICITFCLVEIFTFSQLL